MVILLSLISGALLSASFAPWAIWWCAPLSIAFLLIALEGSDLRKRAWLLFLFGLAFYAPLLHWSSTYVGATPWLILVVLESLYFIPLAFLHKCGRVQFFLFPASWLALELLRTRTPFGGFGWGRLAFSQGDAPFSALARIGGAPLLSLAVLLLALIIYFLLYGQYKNSFIAVAIFALFFTTTFIVPLKSTPATFEVAAVQGGVPALGLNFNSRAAAVFQNHLRTTRKYLSDAKNRPQVILWPENSVDIDPFRNPAVGKALQEIVDEYRIPIVIGAVLNNGEHFSNASILWQMKVGATSIYRKKHLAPFGEYLPLRSLAELISPYAKNITDFTPGEQVVHHRVKTAEIAPIICFELLDDQLGRTMAQGSNLILVQTNSATFGLSAESQQQLAITRIRAIEHSREIVSVATSGISAIIGADGAISQRSLQNQPAVLTQKVPLINQPSLSDRFGGQIEYLLIFVPFLMYFIFYREKKREKGRGE